MKLVVAITGASGAIYGIEFLKELRDEGIETHLIISRWGLSTIEFETGYNRNAVANLVDEVFEFDDMYAAPASGNAGYDGMIVIPCSMKTLSGIKNDYAENLIIRAASVMLKERRKLILVIRETPLSTIQIENMLAVSQAGAIIMPPIPAFYSHPETVDDIVKQAAVRILSQFGIERPLLERWGS